MSPLQRQANLLQRPSSAIYHSYVSKNVKLQQADFLINISSLDILKTLLHKCRVSPSEGITVLNFLSADANMCLHKVRMRITAVRHTRVLMPKI